MRRIGALTGVIAAVLWASPMAVADPVTDPGGNSDAGAPAAPAGTVLTMGEMGSSPTISFYIRKDNTQTGVTFPVPTGMVPQELRAHVELPIFLRYGTITVQQNGRLISRVGLPLNGDGDLVIPLKGVEISGPWLSIDLTLTAIPAADYCWDDYAPIRLTNAAVVFTGGEAVPTTVADFLPPVLRKVTIGVPAKPSQAESNGVVQLAAALAQRNGQNPLIFIVPLPDGKTTLDIPPAPYERQIVVKEGPKKGLSLQGDGVPSLLISGTGKDLAELARVLNSDALKYATSPTAVPDPVPDVDMLSDTTTLGDMNNGNGLRSESTWPSVGISIDQTRFGHPLGGFVVHLVGTYTPLSRDVGGEVTASVEGSVLDRWPASGEGTFDRVINIPDKMIKRSLTLDVTVHTTGNIGHCGEYLPITLRVDPETEIHATSAVPPIPQGFQAFPQALQPRVQIGVASDSLPDTVRAAVMAMDLQRSSGVPLITDLTTLKGAIDGGGSAVLIAPDGLNDPAVQLPFGVDRGKVTVQGVDSKGNSTTMDVNPDVKFGSLQTVFDGKRALLVATSNGAPDRLDDLLRWITERNRWGGLNGRALVGVPGGEPITVPNPPVADNAKPAAASAVGHQNWFWLVAGGVAVLAALGALTILLRARRSAKPRDEE